MEEQIVKEAKDSFTRSAAVKNNVKKHKKKIAVGATIVAGLITFLELWPSICPLIPYNLHCAAQQPAIELGKKGLQQIGDKLEE